MFSESHGALRCPGTGGGALPGVAHPAWSLGFCTFHRQGSQDCRVSESRLEGWLKHFAQISSFRRSEVGCFQPGNHPETSALKQAVVK